MKFRLLPLSLALSLISAPAVSQESHPEIPVYASPDASPAPAPADVPTNPISAPTSADATSTTIAIPAAPVKKSSYRTDTLVGLSYLSWNEKMHLQQNVITAEDDANFTGSALTLEKNMAFAKWGLAYGVTLGSGKASGGSGGSTISFQKGNQSWFMYGVYGKIYKKLTGRLYIGLTLPVFLRQIDWPTDQNGTYASSGKPVNLSLLFDLNLRLNQKWDFYQSIGPFGEQGATLWRIGISYRL